MGFVLLISGWAIAMAALVLLPAATQHIQRLIFVLAALAVESLGLALAANGYKSLQSLKRKPGSAR